ncbi:hypothetical protein GCK72_012496 [Caenorhabditis remanei]|uniref:Uncharacterized protein n=1 Tax=Caenorhabditis remanei TaxID=31234 RepID=A0A6A5GN16_CAERE|nr:hypothetical protein GCK72_012496 [Caenorhabditis remanei]KAF1756043.1 hypothetical protein GCK72_012496 [Caenorhabditis remanei]
MGSTPIVTTRSISSEEKKCVFLNSRETAPALATEKMYTHDKESAQFGYQSIGIPGELHGLWTAYKKYGSKVIPWSDLVMPAAQLAKGFPMHKAMVNYFDRISKYKGRPEIEGLRSLYTSKFTGEFYKVGEIVSNYPLAKLLRVIANSQDPVQLFYNGKQLMKPHHMQFSKNPISDNRETVPKILIPGSIAEGIIKEMLANGGIITIDDLRNYETHVTETLYADLGKYRMCGPPPPSSWTITQAIPRIVEMQYRDKKMFNDAEFYHTLIEAQKLAYGQRGHLGDYLFSEVSMQLAKNLTDRKFIKFLSKRVMAQSQDLEYYLAAVETDAEQRRKAEERLVAEDRRKERQRKEARERRNRREEDDMVEFEPVQNVENDEFPSPPGRESPESPAPNLFPSDPNQPSTSMGITAPSIIRHQRQSARFPLTVTPLRQQLKTNLNRSNSKYPVTSSFKSLGSYYGLLETEQKFLT